MLYILALEDYCDESDKEWSRIMKKAEELKKIQKQTETQKGDTKKTEKYVA